MRSEYFRENYLAGEEVDTPDPSRRCFRGQQIVIHWAEPCRASREIVLTVRYGNRELEIHRHPIKKKRGFWIYRLVNGDYWDHGGIVAYKVELYESGALAPISHGLSDNSHTLSPHFVSRQGGAVLHEHCPHPAGRQSAATGKRFVQRSGEKWGLVESKEHHLWAEIINLPDTPP